MKIFSNLAISLDGKIGTKDRSFFPLGTQADHDRMMEIRKKADAILFGASTLRANPNPCRAPDQIPSPLNVLISHSLNDFDLNEPFFKDQHTSRLFFLKKTLPKLKEVEMQAYGQVHYLTEEDETRTILDILKSHHVENLLIEGGGEIMWLFSQMNLIDYYYVTLTPQIIGGKSAPTLVDGVGFSSKNPINLKLKKCETIGNEIFLEYECESKSKTL